MSRMPSACDVAFKEWRGICDALATGRQSIILRKGGIAEVPGPGGFRPEHETFWLLPTRLHEHRQGLREDILPRLPADPDGGFLVDALARVELCRRVDRPEVLDAIEDLHLWTPETVARRFAYRSPGLWVLGVRILVRGEPSRIAPNSRIEGCKSWVPLDVAISTEDLRPALDDEGHAVRMRRLNTLIGASIDGGEGPHA